MLWCDPQLNWSQIQQGTRTYAHPMIHGIDMYIGKKNSKMQTYLTPTQQDNNQDH